MYIEFDTHLIKDLSHKIIDKSNGQLLGFLMGNTVTFIAEDNDFIIKVLFLKYRVTIIKIPDALSGEFVFKHNLPLDKMDKTQIPSFIKIEKNNIRIKIPSNIITDNLKIADFRMNDDKIYIELN
ncbi:MAG: hypothetical protein ACQESN_08280 [Thermotogota bacterium]